MDVELPAMIGAANAAIFVSAEEQRHPAVRAFFADQPGATFAVAEAKQFLTHQRNAHRRAIRLRNLLRQHGGNPIAAKQISHRRAGAGSDNQIDFLGFGRWHLALRNSRAGRSKADIAYASRRSGVAELAFSRGVREPTSPGVFVDRPPLETSAAPSESADPMQPYLEPMS